MIGPFKYYLFDVDGTLLDSAGDITAAVRQVLAKRGRDVLTEEIIRSHIGRHLRFSFEQLFPDYTEEQMRELISDYREAYLGRNHRSTRVYGGVVEALAALPGRKSTATTKGSETTSQVLELFGLRDHFDHVQGTDGFPAKPEPDVLHRAMAAMGAEAAECLMVGDSPVDVEAGRRAGIKVCVVRYGYGATQVPEDAPDYWVDDLRELAGLPKED